MGKAPFDLERFVEAQAPVYEQVLVELRAGQKRSHWMWFIFPQIQGLGASPTSQHYAIGSLSEARAYLDHPLLGHRLRECTGIVNSIVLRSASDILGWPDELKYRSSMTLFSAAAPDEAAFAEALGKYYGGAADKQTVERLKRSLKSE